MVTLSINMGYKQVKITSETDDLIKDCIDEYLRHHPEMKNIPISRNKILYEMAKFYLK